jgi:hypothetical protein
MDTSKLAQNLRTNKKDEEILHDQEDDGSVVFETGTA